MKLNALMSALGSTKKRIRKGRGIASGKGKTCGRGVKGQKSRSGVSFSGFIGGQLPIYQRIPRRGFNNKNFKLVFAAANVGDLQKYVEAGILKADLINGKAMQEAGIFKNLHDGFKILGTGDIKTAITVEVSEITESAKAKIEKAGGTVKVLEAAPTVEEKKAAKKVAK